MDRYLNSCIYRISCINTKIKDFYIGSTNNFRKRMSSHKKNCSNKNTHHYKYPIYKFIRNNGGWYNFKMEKIFDYSCNNAVELKMKEREFYDKFKPTLNKLSPYVSREEKKIKDKQYYIDNRERLIKYKKKKKYCSICDCYTNNSCFARHLKTKKHIFNLEK